MPPFPLEPSTEVDEFSDRITLSHYRERDRKKRKRLEDCRDNLYAPPAKKPRHGIGTVAQVGIAILPPPPQGQQGVAADAVDGAIVRTPNGNGAVAQVDAAATQRLIAILPPPPQGQQAAAAADAVDGTIVRTPNGTGAATQCHIAILPPPPQGQQAAAAADAVDGTIVRTPNGNGAAIQRHIAILSPPPQGQQAAAADVVDGAIVRTLSGNGAVAQVGIVILPPPQHGQQEAAADVVDGAIVRTPNGIGTVAQVHAAAGILTTRPSIAVKSTIDTTTPSIPKTTIAASGSSIDEAVVQYTSFNSIPAEIPTTSTTNSLIDFTEYPITPSKSKGIASAHGIKSIAGKSTINNTVPTKPKTNSIGSNTNDVSDGILTTEAELQSRMDKLYEERKARPKDHRTLTLNILEVARELRKELRIRYGSRNKEYIKINCQINREESNLDPMSPQKRRKKYNDDIKSGKINVVRAGTESHYNQNIHSYMTMNLEPTRSDKIVLATYGGCILRHANAIPTLEDARQVSYYERSSKIVEGGIVEIPIFDATELDDNDKSKIISVVGRGFAKHDDTDSFSDVDARAAHGLLCNDKHNKDTKVAKILYTYKDPTTGNIMEALVGVMILNASTHLLAHHGQTFVKKSPKTCNVYNMVQICILPAYRMRGLGHIAMVALGEIMKKFKADLLWWVGVETNYYDKYGYKKNPEILNVPFKLDESQDENRKMFYYMEIESESTTKFGTTSTTYKFRDLVNSFYNKKPDKRFFSLHTNNNILHHYYGTIAEYKRKNLSLDQPITHTFNEKLTSQRTDPNPGVIKITIENKPAYKGFTYTTASTVTRRSSSTKSLTVYGQRTGKMGNTYKYVENFNFQKPIKDPEITHGFEGENFFIITIKYNM